MIGVKVTLSCPTINTHTNTHTISNYYGYRKRANESRHCRWMLSSPDPQPCLFLTHKWRQKSGRGVNIMMVLVYIWHEPSVSPSCQWDIKVKVTHNSGSIMSFSTFPPSQLRRCDRTGWGIYKWPLTTSHYKANTTHREIWIPKMILTPASTNQPRVC